MILYKSQNIYVSWLEILISATEELEADFSRFYTAAHLKGSKVISFSWHFVKAATTRCLVSLSRGNIPLSPKLQHAHFCLLVVRLARSLLSAVVI